MTTLIEYDERMEHVIRNATIDDFPGVVSLNEEWVHHTSPLDIEGLAALHDQASYHRVVSSADGIVAFALALREGAEYDSPNYRWFSERGGTFLYIDRIVVSSGCQQLGLGTALYDDLIATAHSAGVPRIVCEVDIEPLNAPSIAFHDRRGFVEVGTQWIKGGAKRVSLREMPL